MHPSTMSTTTDAPRTEPHPRRRHARQRRGSAIVLVTAILVLLVIIAVAFIGQTSGGRTTAVATQDSETLDDRAHVIANDIARHLAESLFARPIDPTDPSVVAGNEANSNYPRGSLDFATAVYGSAGRYGVDPRDEQDPFDFDGDGVLNEPDGYPDFSYNFAPYETVPYTNWPALLGRADDVPGGPGFGDNRALRDTEPNRLTVDGIPYSFSHWQHLSYLPTAENGYRVVGDLANIQSSLVTDLRIPVEQWPPEIASQLTINPNALQPLPGATNFATQFLARRDAWFTEYDSTYQNAVEVLPNLWWLKELGPPSDEFVPGTPRNLVSRTFADTDGDGMTDALWMLAPTTSDKGLRQVVAVSIVDNSALVNVNTASRFVRRSPNEAVIPGAFVPRTATTGVGPIDVALVTAEADSTPVGLLDNPLNQQGVLFGAAQFADIGLNTIGYPPLTVAYDKARWSTAGDGYTMLDELGVLGNTFINTYQAPAEAYLTTDPLLASAADRLRYWKAGGMHPYGDARLGVSPFGVPEELELRLFNGQNLPNVLSRLERAINIGAPGFTTGQILRSNMAQREENNEFIDQLSPEQLLYDMRRKITTNSGAMNDTMPAALWPTPYPPDVNNTDPQYIATYDLVERRTATGRWTIPATPQNGDDELTGEDVVRWQQLIRKYDLRAPMPDPRLMRDLDGNGLILEGANLGGNGANDWELQEVEQREMARDHLRRILERVFTSSGPNGSASYFGTGPQALDRSRSLAASFAANIEAFGDGLSLLFPTNGQPPIPVDRPLSFNDAKAFTDPANPNRRFIGVERQPFIMEAVVAHVYSKAEVPQDYPGPLHPDDVSAGTRVRVPLGQQDEGDHFVTVESDVHTVVVVQIANPYDRPLVLATRPIGGGPEIPEYRVRVFGKSAALRFANCDNVNLNAYATQKIDTNGDGTLDYEQLLLLPCTEDEPRTAIIYAMPEQVDDYGEVGGVVGSPSPPGTDNEFGARWRNFFDIGLAAEPSSLQAQAELFEDNRTPFPDTLRFNATGAWTVDNIDEYSSLGESSVELLRTTGPNWVIVDRIDFHDNGCGTEWEFRDAVGRLREDPQHRPPAPDYFYDPNNPGLNFFNGLRISDNDYFVVWARAGRQWRNDEISPEVDQRGLVFNHQRAPRYVFAERPATEIVSNTSGVKKVIGQTEDEVVGDVFRRDQDPDADPFFVSRYNRRKPTYFTTRTVKVGASDLPPYGYLYPRGFPVRPGGEPNMMPNDVSNSSWDIRFADKSPLPCDDFPFPMQMIVKDEPFDQVGELLLVPMWGPVLENDGSGLKTAYTLSEILSGCASEYPVANGDDPDTDDGIYLNRLRLDDRINDNQAELTWINSNTGTEVDPRQRFRWRLPAGVSLFDAFVCDGPGNWPPRRWAYSATDGFVLQMDLYPYGDPSLPPPTAPLFDHEELAPRNGGGGFAPGLQSTGSLVADSLPVDPSVVQAPGAVRGLININTAPVEVMRALPHMSWMVHSEFVPSNNQLEGARVRVPEAIVQYRDRLADANGHLPNYNDRGLLNGYFPRMRPSRGLASIGELLLLRRASNQVPRTVLGTPAADVPTAASFRIDYGLTDPWGLTTWRWPQRPTHLSRDLRLSTEVNGPVMTPTVNPESPVLMSTGSLIAIGDGVSGDAEEANMLFSGISNLVTTRSDVFTVYLRVRTFRPNPITGIWDATDPEHIVEDSRYVMQVDRSGVRSPSDKPKIVFFEKVGM